MRRKEWFCFAVHLSQGVRSYSQASEAGDGYAARKAASGLAQTPLGGLRLAGSFTPPMAGVGSFFTGPGAYENSLQSRTIYNGSNTDFLIRMRFTISKLFRGFLRYASAANKKGADKFRIWKKQVENRRIRTNVGKNPLAYSLLMIIQRKGIFRGQSRISLWLWIRLFCREIPELVFAFS